jgi:hypothetical protein
MQMPILFQIHLNKLSFFSNLIKAGLIDRGKYKNEGAANLVASAFFKDAIVGRLTNNDSLINNDSVANNSTDQQLAF